MAGNRARSSARFWVSQFLPAPHHLEVSTPPSLKERVGLVLKALSSSLFSSRSRPSGHADRAQLSAATSLSLIPAGWGALHSHSGVGGGFCLQWFFLSMGFGRTFIFSFSLRCFAVFLPGSVLTFICRIKIISLN